MFLDVEQRFKRKNKLLFTHDSACLKQLILLIEQQSHRTLVMWALDCALLPLAQFEGKYTSEKRPRLCLERCKEWASGDIKMPVAKRAILDVHAVAKEINDPMFGALCHAIGHAGATVHVPTHSLGLPFYELTAIVLQYGIEDSQSHVNDKINYYIQQLQYWESTIDQLIVSWARFL